MSQFFIFALPRSRTFWTSRFLCQKGWVCHHDLVARLANLKAIEDIMSEPRSGLADTGLALGWRYVRERFPESRFAVIRRNRKAVEDSIRALGLDPRWANLDDLEHALDELDQQPGTLSIDFDELDHEAPVRALVHHCLGTEFDFERWEAMRHVNLQIDMKRRLEQLRRNHDRLRALKQKLKVHDHVPA